MSLEATLFCVDNSEWMRNGDYTPSRLEAQADAVNLISSAKTGANQENTIGLMTTAGVHPEVLVTLTPEMGKVLSALPTIKLKGSCKLVNAIQVAQLALKHRQNKSQRQRIVLFVGSPLEEDERALVRLGKKLKKYNVAVDVVNFGEQNDNVAKLEAFVNAVDSGNSHLVTIPPGPHILSDVLISSAVVAGDDGATPANVARTGPGGSFEFVDANMDPDLAMALRISMEEERARQERAAAASGQTGAAPSTPATTMSAPLVSGLDEMDEEAMLAHALALSMGEVPAAAAPSAAPVAAPMQTDEDDMSEEAMLARAIAESLRDSSSSVAATSSAAASSAAPAPAAMPTNADQLVGMLGSLPGVNPDDPAIKEMLDRLAHADDKPADKPKDNKPAQDGSGGSS